MILFPHQGRIVKVDQITFYTFDPNTNDSVPFVWKIPSRYENFGVGLLKDSSLIGTCALPLPDFPTTIAQVNMILSNIGSYDPWIVPTESYYKIYDDRIPFSPIE